MGGQIKIENVVASASFDQELDLEKICSELENAEYNQGKFPGLVYRLASPKTAALIFSSGKLVCIGAKNVEDVETAVDKVIEKLRDAGVEIKEKPETVVQNIVASADLDHPLDLEQIAIGFGLEKVEYEPEQFPGLVYRLDEPNVVLLLFGTGKIVCAGAREPEDCEKGVERAKKDLKDLGLL